MAEIQEVRRRVKNMFAPLVKLEVSREAEAVLSREEYEDICSSGAAAHVLRVCTARERVPDGDTLDKLYDDAFFDREKDKYEIWNQIEFSVSLSVVENTFVLESKICRWECAEIPCPSQESAVYEITLGKNVQIEDRIFDAVLNSFFRLICLPIKKKERMKGFLGLVNGLKINPSNVAHKLEADIMFLCNKYKEAYRTYAKTARTVENGDPLFMYCLEMAHYCMLFLQEGEYTRYQWRGIAHHKKAARFMYFLFQVEEEDKYISFLWLRYALPYLRTDVDKAIIEEKRGECIYDSKLEWRTIYHYFLAAKTYEENKRYAGAVRCFCMILEKLPSEKCCTISLSILYEACKLFLVSREEEKFRIFMENILEYPARLLEHEYLQLAAGNEWKCDMLRVCAQEEIASNPCYHVFFDVDVENRTRFDLEVLETIFVCETGQEIAVENLEGTFRIAGRRTAKEKYSLLMAQGGIYNIVAAKIKIDIGNGLWIKTGLKTKIISDEGIPWVEKFVHNIPKEVVKNSLFAFCIEPVCVSCDSYTINVEGAEVFPETRCVKYGNPYRLPYQARAGVSATLSITIETENRNWKTKHSYEVPVGVSCTGNVLITPIGKKDCHNVFYSIRADFPITDIVVHSLNYALVRTIQTRSCCVIHIERKNNISHPEEEFRERINRYMKTLLISPQKDQPVVLIDNPIENNIWKKIRKSIYLPEQAHFQISLEGLLPEILSNEIFVVLTGAGNRKEYFFSKDWTLFDTIFSAEELSLGKNMIFYDTRSPRVRMYNFLMRPTGCPVSVVLEHPAHIMRFQNAVVKVTIENISLAREYEGSFTSQHEDVQIEATSIILPRNRSTTKHLKIVFLQPGLFDLSKIFLFSVSSWKIVPHIAGGLLTVKNIS